MSSTHHFGGTPPERAAQGVALLRPGRPDGTEQRQAGPARPARDLHARARAEVKLRAVVTREPGWQRALSKPARRIVSGACGPAAFGAFLMPGERTTADHAARRDGRDTARHGVSKRWRPEAAA